MIIKAKVFTHDDQLCINARDIYDAIVVKEQETYPHFVNRIIYDFNLYKCHDYWIDSLSGYSMAPDLNPVYLTLRAAHAVAYHSHNAQGSQLANYLLGYMHGHNYSAMSNNNFSCYLEDYKQDTRCERMCNTCYGYMGNPPYVAPGSNMEYLREKIEKATPYWQDVPDAEEWVREVRGDAVWEVGYNGKYVTRWQCARWVCDDGDLATLDIQRDETGFILRCFSGVPASSINVDETDFPRLWRKAGYETDMGKFTFTEQCQELAEWLCGLFCE